MVSILYLHGMRIDSEALIIPQYGSLYLRDDYYKSDSKYTQEESPNYWSFIDNDHDRGMIVYICSNSGSVDNTSGTTE